MPYIYNPFTRSIAIIGEGVVCVEVFAVDGTVLKRKNRLVEPVHIRRSYAHCAYNHFDRLAYLENMMLHGVALCREAHL